LLKKYGDHQVTVWRRSYAIRPPGGEVCRTPRQSTRLLWERNRALLKQGHDILIVAHGNSLRALMMNLEQLSEEAIAEVNLPTGTPRLYTLNEQLKIEKVAYL